ncbi:MAG: conjugal transfer protein, partial [Oscillospiraceae bacterium]|nr:conjugal transfer protein [Oscillospiraceae bacterium]
MDNEKQDYVIIRSYAKTWKIDSRIYAIGNIILPFPITMTEVGYFVISVLLVLLISSVIPPLTAIPSLIRYLVAPIMLTRVVSRQKVDGMNPIKFFGTLIVHLFTNKLYVERFKYHNLRENSKNKLDWWCSRVKLSDTLRRK